MPLHVFMSFDETHAFDRRQVVTSRHNAQIEDLCGEVTVRVDH